MKIDEMWIYIPTLGRVDKQITIKNIPVNWLTRTKIVVMPEEYEALKAQYGDIVVICPNRGLSPTRQWIVDSCPGRYVFMMDDDITFYTRYSGIKLRKSTVEEVNSMLDQVLGYLESGIPAVGISVRMDNFHILEDYKDIGKICSLYALDTQVLADNGIKFRLPLMEDFDIILSLLEKGYPNRVIYNYAWAQAGSGAEGGCSLIRTSELQKESADKLKALHPKSVTVVQKATDPSNIWGGLSNYFRTDVNIKWQKAYEATKKKEEHKKIFDRFSKKKST